MSEAQSPAVWTRKLARRGRWQSAAWVFGVASWLYLMIVTDFKLLAISVWSVPFLLLLVVVSSPWRSVSWSTLVSLFVLGMGPVLVAVVLVQRLIGLTPLEGWVRDISESLASSGVTSFIAFPGTVVFAPILEEFFKVAPLIALLLWRRSRIRALAGPIDYAVMAGATGAGFGFGEHILVYLNQGILHGPPSSVFALNLGPAYRSLVGVSPAPFESDYTNVMSFLYAEMESVSGVVWSGHGALAMGLGLAIGLAVWGSRRFRNRLPYLVVPVIYLWVVWEHMMANWYGGAGCAGKDLVMCKLAELDLTGRIFPIVALVGWGVAIYLCSSALRYYRTQDVLFGSIESSRDAYRNDGWRGPVRYARDWLDARRWRRKASYGVEHLRRGRRVNECDANAMVAARLRGLTIGNQLGGQRADADPEFDLALARAAPLD